MPPSASLVYSRIIVVLLAFISLGLFWTTVSVTRIANELESEESRDEPAERVTSQRSDPPRPTNSGVPSVDVSPAAGLSVPGISHPVLCRADEADVEESAKVIGIEAGGNARAYVVEAFEVHSVSQPEDLAVHIVNDVISGQPVCVTHCNLTHSTRVFTRAYASSEPEPIDARVAGWSDGLLLKYKGHQYRHHAPDIPLDDMPFVTATWEEWLAVHPNTLVYTGGQGGG